MKVLIALSVLAIVSALPQPELQTVPNPEVSTLEQSQSVTEPAQLSEIEDGAVSEQTELNYNEVDNVDENDDGDDDIEINLEDLIKVVDIIKDILNKTRNNIRGPKDEDDRDETQSSFSRHPKDDRNGTQGFFAKHPRDDRNKTREASPKHPKGDRNETQGSFAKHPRNDRNETQDSSAKHPKGDRNETQGSFAKHPRDDRNETQDSSARDPEDYSDEILGSFLRHPDDEVEEDEIIPVDVLSDGARVDETDSPKRESIDSEFDDKIEINNVLNQGNEIVLDHEITNVAPKNNEGISNQVRILNPIRVDPIFATTGISEPQGNERENEDIKPTEESVEASRDEEKLPNIHHIRPWSVKEIHRLPRPHFRVPILLD